MRFLHLSLDTLMLRYYLMMVVIIVAGFSGVWLLSLLALPIFLSCLLGISFGKTPTSEKSATKPAKMGRISADADDDSIQHAA